MSDKISETPPPGGSGRITETPPPGAVGAVEAGVPGRDVVSTTHMVLFWASFLTLIAAGIGFSVRAGVLGDWSSQFGFTQTELGGITGGGLVGFGLTIIFFSFFADRVGYGPLMIIAFLLHFSSAVVTLAATPVFAAYGKDATYWTLFVGMFLFALGNGTCEAVINPLTAALFPRNKVHWLNILHAGWPGGLILGALLVLGFNKYSEWTGVNIRWEVKMGIFLVPTLAYGVMMVGRHFPRSEASAAGISLGTMLMEFAAPILILLLCIHAMVGYVELGTDSWITNITGTILENPNYGLMLFIWASGLMFALRFFAGPIVHKISPLGLLFVSACLACTGLLLLGNTTGALLIVIAATVYGFGKTFFWPTMLGVVSERYPRGGALTLGAVGGVGMLSAGLLGGPGIGYQQDYFATHQLRSTSAAAYERYKASESNRFLVFSITGLDGRKVAVLFGDPEKDAQGNEVPGTRKIIKEDKNYADLAGWWEKEGAPNEKQDKEDVGNARLYGGQKALTWTAAVPAAMALCYLFLIFYFRMKGGYQAQVLTGHAAKDEEFTGGVPGPAEL